MAFMLGTLGQGLGSRGSNYPDLLFTFKQGPPLLLEVGGYDPGKWPEELPVVHVAKNHRVSLVNWTGRQEEFTALTLIRTTVHHHFYHERVKQWAVEDEELMERLLYVQEKGGDEPPEEPKRPSRGRKDEQLLVKAAGGWAVWNRNRRNW